MQRISQNSDVNPVGNQPNEINTEPPPFCALNWAAKIKVGAMFALSAACFIAGGFVMAGTIALGTPVAVSFFLAGTTLFFQARQALNQAKTEQQLEDNEYVTRVNADEIVAIQIKLTEISADLASLFDQHEDIDGQHVILGQRIRETQDRLRTQLHYLGQLAKTNAKQ